MSSMLATHSSVPFERCCATGYQSASYSSRTYDCHTHTEDKDSWYFGGLPTPPEAKAMNGISLTHNGPSYSSNSYASKYPYPTAADNAPLPQRPMNPFSHSSTQVTQYTVNGVSGQRSHGLHDQENAIASHLQIPESVNKSKGSLAEFAAEICCLFWFETTETLQYAEDLPVDESPNRGLVRAAFPTTGFRKWVTTILSTTQVGKNVILLGLMFIYRLKKFNPGVSGKLGSEFRLLTIALMLGNKFLDDNTYTNKTWAEVSGISVTEIHIMEVEFLSNMRYDLYVSESEWLEWKAALGRLGAFYEKASKLPFHDGGSPVTPIYQGLPYKLPSPPSTHHSAASPYINGHNQQQVLPNPALNVPQLNRSPHRQQRFPSADILEQRKRSLDFGSELPPAKRLHFQDTASVGTYVVPGSHSSRGYDSASVPPPPGNGMESVKQDQPRLPMPRIPMPASSGTQLAPLNMSTGRAMSQVYPAMTTSWSQPLTPVSTVPPNLYQHPIPSLGEASQTHSRAPSAHPSPHAYTPGTQGLPGLSPSYFLDNRSSPYRPVRHVNTLLIPPPSTAMQNQGRNIAHEQIRYQPLSKASNEYRSGPVPYLQTDGWNQNTVLTPLAQKYPYRM